MPVPLIEPGFAARGERLGHGAETAVAGAELADGGGERRGIEIGPHAGREDQLGIGAFPEEEIAETALTASADAPTGPAGGSIPGHGPPRAAKRRMAIPPPWDALRNRSRGGSRAG